MHNLAIPPTFFVSLISKNLELKIEYTLVSILTIMSSYPTDKIEEVEELLTVSSILSMTLKLRDIVLSNFEAIYNQSIEENLEDYNIIC